MKTVKNGFTEKESALISAIINSNYSDGNILEPVWMPLPEECGFDNNKTLSGVISQLVQKGFIYSEGQGKDATVGMTQKYINLI